MPAAPEDTAALLVLVPGMSRTQTALLEKKLAGASARALNVPPAQDADEVLSAVHRDRVTLGHCPPDGDKALAGKITRAVREVMSNPRLSVRTTALGSGRFRIRLPSTSAASAGLDSTQRTPSLGRLELAAGAGITVTSVTASRAESWLFSVVHLRAEVVPAESTGSQPRREANQGPVTPLPAGSRERRDPATGLPETAGPGAVIVITPPDGGGAGT